MEKLYKYLLNNGKKLVVSYDEYCDSPREWEPIGKFCIRKHRNYTFPNELSRDFTSEEDPKEYLKNYYIFPLDCYEHSGIMFSLLGEGMQCKFDTAKNCWFIAVPKKYDWYSNKERETSDKKNLVELTEEEATSIARDELEVYNQWINWECYSVEI